MNTLMPYKDPERQREYAREWIRRNADKAREAMRRWRARNPELRRERNKLYKRAAHLRAAGRINAQKAAYLERHPEVRRAKEQAYRARERAAPGAFTGEEWLALVDRYGGLCGYDGAAGPLEADHRTPLSRGGSNAIDNIIPACHRCNARKHRLTEAEFRARIASERGENLQSE